MYEQSVTEGYLAVCLGLFSRTLAVLTILRWILKQVCEGVLGGVGVLMLQQVRVGLA